MGNGAQADRGSWNGEKIICVGSGPSLTAEDCELAQESGHRIIAVNNSWMRAPKCDLIYASDYAWWKRYAESITVPAERWTNNKKAAQEFQARLWVNNNGYNSGLAAMHLALWLGASQIVLLGYDCKPDGKLLHWHGSHVKCNNPNEISFKMWQRQFQRSAPLLKSRVVNCSRETALTCYARQSLEEVLNPRSMEVLG